MSRSNSECSDDGSTKSKCSSTYSNISDESLTLTSTTPTKHDSNYKPVDFLQSKKFKNNFFKDKNIILHKNKVKSNKIKKQTIKTLLDIKDSIQTTTLSPKIKIDKIHKLKSDPTTPHKKENEHKRKESKKRIIKDELKQLIQPIKNETKEMQINHMKPDDLNLSNEEITLFESIMHREFDPNGGATILSVSQEDIDTKLNLCNKTKDELIEKFATYFITNVYSESKIENESDTNISKRNDDSSEILSTKENDINQSSTTSTAKTEKAANYVLGVVRNSAEYLPDLLDYFAENHPSMTVKTSLLLNTKEINTLKISEYRKNVNSTYLNGTYRYGPLLQTSIVGIRNEEIGGYFPNLIDIIEKNKFLKKSLPWSEFSINHNMSPLNSDDGPIIWYLFNFILDLVAKQIKHFID